MKILISLFGIATFLLSYSQDEVSGLVYKGVQYTVQISDLKDGSRSAKDTIKSDFIFIVNTSDKFLFFKQIAGLSPDKTVFKEFKVKDMTSESTKTLGFTQKQMFSVSFPYEKTDEMRPSFISINYDSFNGGIVVKISAKNSEKSVSYELFVNQSQYLNWDKGLVFQKEYEVDKYILEKDKKEGAEVATTGKIILSDTAVVVESPKYSGSNSYEYIFTTKDGSKAFMSAEFIGSFPKEISIKDKWFQIMLDRNAETKEWGIIHWFRKKK